jgi:hypothetical protein
MGFGGARDFNSRVTSVEFNFWQFWEVEKMNPRAESYAAIVSARQAIERVPEVLTVQTVGEVKLALNAVLKAVAKSVEWTDAIELN